jgi:hypothetical protein
MILPFVLSLLVSPAPQGADKLTSVRAYVFTETSASGQPSDDERSRLDGVRELKEALAKKKGISLVDHKEDATLVIEVTDRQVTDDSSGPFGGKKLTSLGETILRVHLTSGGQESDLKGIGQGSPPHAANDAADRILKWIARREPARGSI